MKLGIGITTHNRPDVFKKSYSRIIANTPAGVRVVVVDDASSSTIDEATYRFETNVGIAKAKNKCLELLDDCDHIFLFDDDTYPIVKDWWKPYVESSEPHLMYCFDKWDDGSAVGDDLIYYADDFLVAHKAARGCMIYIDRKVLNTVGGFDTAYGKAMNEHGDWSNRIHNAGLTTFQYADVVNSQMLIYSADQHRSVISSIDSETRHANLIRNNIYLSKNKHSSQYREYRDGKDTSGIIKGAVITTYLTCGLDTQRGKVWDADYSATQVLRDSIDGNADLYLLNDCFDTVDYGTIKHVRVASSGNPYFMRWLAIWRFLIDREDITDVWLVDSTDTELLSDGLFSNFSQGVIYSGDEQLTVGTPWMRGIAKDPKLQDWICVNQHKPLLNCGVIGGSRMDVMDICRRIYDTWVDGGCLEIVEMPIYNMIMRRRYENSIKYGRGITTEFKKFERGGAIWRHK